MISTLHSYTTNTQSRRKTKGQQLTAVWRNDGLRGKLNSSSLNKHLCLIYSEVLLNPPLRKAANHYQKLLLKFADTQNGFIF